jgi:redox-sensitive bicupin YhaK (pirin superfamily)
MSDVDLVIEARARDLGDGFVVGRVLPSPRRRIVGPWLFFDHMGPAELAPGRGLTVRPQCSFVRVFIQRNPAYADLVAA